MSQVDNMIPSTMKAVAIDQFGGPEELKLKILPIPDISPNKVLIRVNTAGVGVWDPMDRQGFFAKMQDTKPNFPYIIGGDGAGTVVAVGEQVKSFAEGDRVYAYGGEDPQAKFYAEYVAVGAGNVAPLPKNLSLEEAGSMPADAITAIFGLDQILDLQANQTLLIFGASGGLGHLAVQFAKRIGAKVFAIASGKDGVEFVQSLGVDQAVNGYDDNIIEAAQQFAPDGFDAALLTAGGEVAEQAISTVRDGGRVAYPNGIEPIPEARSGVDFQSYNGRATPELFNKLNHLIEQGPFTVNVAQTFSLEEAAKAHRTLDGHYLGKLALKIRDTEEQT